MVGSQYSANQVVHDRQVRECLEQFLAMLRERRRPFAFFYFHTQMGAFNSGPLPRIRHVINQWPAAEQALLVQYDVIHPRWYTKFRDSFRRHPDPDVRFCKFKTVVEFLVSMADDPLMGQRLLSSLPKEIVNVYL